MMRTGDAVRRDGRSTAADAPSCLPIDGGMPATGRPRTARSAIVVVSFGSAHLLERHLVPSAQGIDLVVVVDCYRDDDERARVRDLAHRHGWVLVLPARNLGFGAGAGAGVAEAYRRGADVVLLLNPDASITPQARDLVLDAVRADPMTLVAPRVQRPDGGPWMSGVLSLDLRTGRMRPVAARRRHPAPPHTLPWVSGACVAVSRELWVRTGGLAGDYFLYWEDVDLCWAVAEAGGAVRVLPDAVAVHDEGGTHPDARVGRARSATYYYFVIRNRMVFARRRLPARAVRRWHLTAVPAARDVVLQGGRRQLLRPAPWVAAARGLLDGALGRRPELVAAGGPVRVLTSSPRPRPTTNPYIVMLGDALDREDAVDLQRFSWPCALVGRYDVVHLHWPEALFDARSPARAAAKTALFLLWMARLRLRRIPVVRTAHNAQGPVGLSRAQEWGLRRAARLTTVEVALNDVDVHRPGMPPVRRIVHGHYRDWYAPHPRALARPGHLLFVGMIRRYKGVEQLLSAFDETRDRAPGLRLTVAGRPSSQHLARSVADAAARDRRVVADLHFLDDAELVRAITSAQVVVLPYPHMHNSGAVLAALSLGRPVLVPDTEVNRRLAAEVGAGWVMTFKGRLTGDELVRAVAAGVPPGEPDLSARGWQDVGRAYLAVYREALQRREAHRPVGP